MQNSIIYAYCAYGLKGQQLETMCHQIQNSKAERRRWGWGYEHGCKPGRPTHRKLRLHVPGLHKLQSNQGSRARHSGGCLVLVGLEESQKQWGNVQRLALLLWGRAAATLRFPVLGGTKQLHMDILGTLRHFILGFSVSPRLPVEFSLSLHPEVVAVYRAGRASWVWKNGPHRADAALDSHRAQPGAEPVWLRMPLHRLERQEYLTSTMGFFKPSIILLPRLFLFGPGSDHFTAVPFPTLLLFLHPRHP